MALNSFSFILLFLPLVAVGFRLLRSQARRGARLWLAAASLGFYACGGLRDTALLLASIVFNAILAKYIVSTNGPWRRRTLILALFANIAFLSAFKYTAFLFGSLSPRLPWLHSPHWGLPLGISFFTLQQVMYLVDCYEGLIPPNSFLDHVLFVSFFPAITAGPITRAKPMVPQFDAHDSSRTTSQDVARGLALFSAGLFKKTVVADALGTLVDTGYGDAASLGHRGAWICSIAYAMQLYLDFSGYSDMAIGVARILGLVLPKNFETPYRATSISEFWQRWHITLSQFITNYLYTPLIRSMGRATTHKAVAATLVAMSIAGLWHGPSWNYVIFGVIHGVALGAYQYWRKWKRFRLPRAVAWVATMLVVNVGFIFFRAPTLTEAAHTCRMLLPGGGMTVDPILEHARGTGLVWFVPVWLMAPLIIAFERPSERVLSEFRPTLRLAGLVVMMLLSAMVFMNSSLGREFVYAGF